MGSHQENGAFEESGMVSAILSSDIISELWCELGSAKKDIRTALLAVSKPQSESGATANIRPRRGASSAASEADVRLDAVLSHASRTRETHTTQSASHSTPSSI